MTDAPRDPLDGAPDDQPVEGELIDGTGPPADPAGGDVSFETLLADLERVATERDQFLDAYRRAQADFENFRKQSTKRHEDNVTRAVGGLVESLLPVLDACDAALQPGASEVEPILGAPLGALDTAGLVRIDPGGEPFDPPVAEGVGPQPGGAHA